MTKMDGNGTSDPERRPLLGLKEWTSGHHHSYLQYQENSSGGLCTMILKTSTSQYMAGFAGSMSVMIGATCVAWVAPMLNRLLGPDSPVPMTTTQSSWMVSMMELGPFLTPTIFGILSDKLGRKPCIHFSVFLYFLSWLLIVFTRSVASLYLARILQGMGLGITFTIVPMYLGEIAENRIRGALTTLFQTMFHVGLVFEYCIGPYFSYETVGYASAILPLIFFVLFSCQEESPYYYLMKRDDHRALIALTKLRGNQSSIKVEEELKEMKNMIENDMAKTASWKDIIETHSDRKALFLAITATITKASCGFLAILSYATEAFRLSGASYLTPDEYTLIIGLLMTVVVAISTPFVDRIGRRPLILVSSFGCFICNILVSIYFYMLQYSDVDISHYTWITFAGIAMFSFFFSFGLGPVVLTLQSELFPSHTRSKASGFCALSFTIASFLSIKYYQVLADSAGVYMNYCLYGTFCLFGFIILLVFLPETKGKSFTEIQEQLGSNQRR